MMNKLDMLVPAFRKHVIVCLVDESQYQLLVVYFYSGIHIIDDLLCFKCL